VTLIAAPKAEPAIDEAQLLFMEAKARRRRRWVRAGIVAAVAIVVLAVVIGFVPRRGRGGSVTPAAISTSVVGAGHAAANLSFRPALCYAPPLTLSPGESPSTGPLPTCSPASRLSAANLQVNPNPDNISGYSTNLSAVRPDGQFATYASTPAASGKENATVLVPATAWSGGGRYVLGPAGLTNHAISTASVQHIAGQWVINLDLTDEGALQWDTMAEQQFHQMIGIDLNGQVISAPIMQPTQSSFTPFDGRLQISGGFSEAHAKAIAAELR
jgi:preprotein translocase subunit SecD